MTEGTKPLSIQWIDVKSPAVQVQVLLLGMGVRVGRQGKYSSLVKFIFFLMRKTAFKTNNKMIQKQSHSWRVRWSVSCWADREDGVLVVGVRGENGVLVLGVIGRMKYYLLGSQGG